MHPKRSSTTLRLEGPRNRALRKLRRPHCECHGLAVLGRGGSAAASDGGGLHCGQVALALVQHACVHAASVVIPAVGLSCPFIDFPRGCYKLGFVHRIYRTAHLRNGPVQHCAQKPRVSIHLAFTGSSSMNSTVLSCSISEAVQRLAMVVGCTADRWQRCSTWLASHQCFRCRWWASRIRSSTPRAGVHRAA